MIERIYIGTYSNNIKICEFNNGKLKVVGSSSNIENPSYIHINGDILYAVSETNDGSIETFKIIGNSLEKLHLEKINESLPCYISTDNNRKYLLVANYKSGSVIMYELQDNGIINKEKFRNIYDNANMHYADFSENYIYTVDLGNNNIYIYDYEMNLQSTINTGEKTGPRHIAVSKNEKTIYVVTELSNEILVYKKNNDGFNLVQRASTIMDRNLESYVAAIKVTQDNKNIYITNRGHNSISVFDIKNNRVELIQNISSYGEFPRDIFLNYNEKYVMIANQISNNIVIYERAKETGELNKIEGSNIEIDKPSCIIGGKI